MPGSTTPWGDIERQRYLIVNSVAKGGLLQAEVASYTPQGGSQPTRVVVRVNQPATIWTAGTSYPSGTLIMPTPVGGHGYVCTTAGTSGATAPAFPTTIGATVADGTAVWTCLGPATPLWTFKVADIVSLDRVVTSGGVTQIFTSGGGNSPVGTVTVAAARLTWTAAGAADISVDFDIVELQSTICTVDPTHPNHSSSQPASALLGAPLRPTRPVCGLTDRAWHRLLL